MIEWLVEKMAAWCERLERVEYITGSGGRTDIYMIRYFVVKSRFFNLYIHRFMRSDRDDLHDHPWNFATYLVRGAYTERKWNPSLKRVEVTRRTNYKRGIEIKGNDGGPYPIKHIKFNTLVFRKATDQHQVVIDQVHRVANKQNAPLTICLTGPKIRDWGFIREVTVQTDGKTPISDRYRPIREWVPYQTYFNQEKR